MECPCGDKNVPIAFYVKYMSIDFFHFQNKHLSWNVQFFIW